MQQYIFPHHYSLLIFFFSIFTLLNIIFHCNAHFDNCIRLTGEETIQNMQVIVEGGTKVSENTFKLSRSEGVNSSGRAVKP